MSEATILVVDDEPGVLRLCQRLLEKAGYEVIATPDANQALAILSAQPVNMLLADIRMPDIDGFQLLSLARNQQPDLAVLVITGYGTVETALEALRRGADGLILKPFSANSLLEGVQNALADSQQKRDLIQLRALRPLFDLTDLLFTETDPLHLRRLILNALCQYLQCGEAGLFWQKSPHQELELVESRGEILKNISYSEYRGLVERLWVRKIPLWISREALREANHIDGRERAEIEEIFNLYQLRSFMCVPVVHKNGSSLMLVARRQDQPAFREADLEMFMILSRQSALALENAHLYADLLASIETLEKSQHIFIQAEKMAAAGRLTASIAHEINNPLQSVSNCLHLACRAELSSTERETYIDLAQNELDRLMLIVQRVLDLYRPGARDRQPVMVDDIIRHVLLLVDQELKKSSIEVLPDLAAGKAKVMAIRSHLQQVLLNLILNAMEAMPGGGKLFIETRRFNKEVEIIIEDTGPGIPEEEREMIFEPFISTKENGTGLGLTVSYGIVSAFGGTLDLTPGRGQGACFRIILPIGDAR